MMSNFDLRDMLRAQKALGYDRAGRCYLQIIKQCSGDIVTIPPGWPHSVYNLQVSSFRM
jgi:oxalate decarboxylase/phosphoglucose isomerase-like protein (cupin superfamily)